MNRSNGHDLSLVLVGRCRRSSKRPSRPRAYPTILGRTVLDCGRAEETPQECPKSLKSAPQGRELGAAESNVVSPVRAHFSGYPVSPVWAMVRKVSQSPTRGGAGADLARWKKCGLGRNEPGACAIGRLSKNHCHGMVFGVISLHRPAFVNRWFCQRYITVRVCSWSAVRKIGRFLQNYPCI